jgi:hypothetical protein
MKRLMRPRPSRRRDTATDHRVPPNKPADLRGNNQGSRQ